MVIHERICQEADGNSRPRMREFLYYNMRSMKKTLEIMYSIIKY